MPTRPRLAPVIGAAVKDAARATAIAAVSVLALLSMSNPTARAAEPAGAPGPPLGSLIIAHPLPAYSVAPYGPTNGPLTASEYASQSSAPQRAQNQFSALAAQPGFGASIRLWTDRSGVETGDNDVAVLLFRIPDVTDAKAFELSLRTPFGASADSSPYAVSSIPGAHAYTVQIDSPVHAAEQVVVFRAGEYVAMIELASSLSASNPTVLTPSEAVAVSVGQYWTLGKDDPVGSRAQSAPPESGATQATPGTLAATSSRGGTLPIIVAAVAVTAIIGCATLVLLLRRRRRRRRQTAVSQPDTTTDPWGPGGLLESFGATIPDPDLGDHLRIPAPTIAPMRPVAREVPALANPESLESPSDQLVSFEP